MWLNGNSPSEYGDSMNMEEDCLFGCSALLLITHVLKRKRRLNAKSKSQVRNAVISWGFPSVCDLSSSIPLKFRRRVYLVAVPSGATMRVSRQKRRLNALAKSPVTVDI